MEKINENIFHQYNKWKQGYSRKENSFKQRVQNFLSNREDADIYSISKDSKYLNAYYNVVIHDEDIRDGKLPVPFGEIRGDFECSRCDSLISLEGAPKKVGKNFNCSKCKNLLSLEGAPKELGGAFDCSDCEKLTSLVGVPKKIHGYFDCSGCENLTSLEYLPKEIAGDLYIGKRFKGKIPEDVIVKGVIQYE